MRLIGNKCDKLLFDNYETGKDGHDKYNFKCKIGIIFNLKRENNLQRHIKCNILKLRAVL